MTAHTFAKVGLRVRADVECSPLPAPIPAQPQLSSEVVFNQCREGRRLRALVAREKPDLASPLRFPPCIGVYIPFTQTLTNRSTKADTPCPLVYDECACAHYPLCDACAQETSHLLGFAEFLTGGLILPAHKDGERQEEVFRIG